MSHRYLSPGSRIATFGMASLLGGTLLSGNAFARSPEEYKPGAKGQIRTGLILITDPPKQVQYSAIDGLAIFQGDIILGSVAQMDQQKPGTLRALVARDSCRWPDAVIPYRMAPDLPDETRSMVNQAIDHWHQNTVIRFRERIASDRDFVTVQPSDGCSSHMGRQGGEQFINLAEGCDKRGAIHEIGHTVGLWHEQSREDRDNFVTINWDNIREDKRRYFSKHITDGDDSGPYDYRSIMHYPAFTADENFAINPSLPIILSSQSIGQGDGLSVGDVAAVQAFYPRWEEDARIFNQSSKAPPALAEYNGKLYMVHVGSSSNDLWWSVFDGHEWSPNRKIDGQSSKTTPALAVFNGKLYMVHVGSSSNDLWWSTFDGNTWTQNVKIDGQSSKATPALAVFNGKLHMVHVGSSSDALWWSWLDGKGWFPNVKIAGQSSKTTPALAAFGGKLHMVHLGSSSNDLCWSYSDGFAWRDEEKIPNQSSRAAPALAAHGNRLHMVHLGKSSNNLWQSSFDGQSWRPNVRIPRQTSQAAPALAFLGRQLYMVHLGESTNNIWYSWYLP